MDRLVAGLRPYPHLRGRVTDGHVAQFFDALSRGKPTVDVIEFVSFVEGSSEPSNAMSLRELSGPNLEARVWECFQEADRDSSGTMDRKTLFDALHRMGLDFSESALEVLWSAADVHGAGKVEWHDFAPKLVAMLEDPVPQPPPVPDGGVSFHKYKNVEFQSPGRHTGYRHRGSPELFAAPGNNYLETSAAFHEGLSGHRMRARGATTSMVMDDKDTTIEEGLNEADLMSAAVQYIEVKRARHAWVDHHATPIAGETPRSFAEEVEKFSSTALRPQEHSMLQSSTCPDETPDLSTETEHAQGTLAVLAATATLKSLVEHGKAWPKCGELHGQSAHQSDNHQMSVVNEEKSARANLSSGDLAGALSSDTRDAIQVGLVGAALHNAASDNMQDMMRFALSDAIADPGKQGAADSSVTPKSGLLRARLHGAISEVTRIISASVPCNTFFCTYVCTHLLLWPCSRRHSTCSERPWVPARAKIIVRCQVQVQSPRPREQQAGMIIMRPINSVV